ncbi:hypothetical protein AQI88_25825 [Streptomyces cellostaticus]|uniref:Uncharacterized protein n=1 Tax=Streptomyces cellostaticus TaxID=67285 RepID=A0A101NIB5_9ACTN|nr:hypothetical protein [Streptomyces cellostaticus]KUM93838.1 hypothetical protein AQI88_25825 [Streptomyces cellostaticus]GHI07740.1 hypothetical protein Scel_60610 [Streptomyces cellostaticus]
MSAEIVQLMEQAGPYLTAALGAYGAAVLGRAEDAAADATASVGRRLLRAVWLRRDMQGRAELEVAVQDAVDEPDGADAVGALRQQIKRALREDAELLREVVAFLPAVGATSVTASGAGAVAAGGNIGVAITGNKATYRRP